MNRTPAWPYPPSRRDDVVDTLHGQDVRDPYRWLEDPDAEDTRAWVAAQNQLTESYLAALPGRDWFTQTMHRILQRPRTGVPFVRGGRYFLTRNDGDQDQDVWCVADSLEDLLDGGRVLIDPNTWSESGTVSVSSFTVSPDGVLACYGRSEAGSDWERLIVLDLATGAEVPDAEITTKFSEAVWLPDSRSFLYLDFARHGEADGTRPDAMAGGRLRLHRLGRPVTEDQLIVEFPDYDQLICWPELSHDRRWLVLSITEGTENRNRLWVYPVVADRGMSVLGEPVRVVDQPVASFGFVRSTGDRLVLFTDLAAPRGRVVSAEVAEPAVPGLPELVELVPETSDTVEHVVAAGDALITSVLRDATPLLRRYGLDGTDHGPLPLHGGAVTGLAGDPDSTEAFVGLSRLTVPTAVFRLDTADGSVRPLPELVQGRPGFVPPEIEVERHRATSPDGTEVPYFLVRPAGAARDRPQPLLLYGYGGFKVSILADYRPGWPAWLAAGGLLAIANLRGGGEFGTDWYDQGRLAAKQNVFDDFIAVAEDLISAGVTAPERLAVHGRSNGGLLVGAVLTRRPDLFAAAVPAVGVMDLVRFHRFTIGAAWISDYGDPDDPGQFADALAYSPLHTIAPGTAYPATLVLTGDHDDRVVPLHSHKFTATLQAAQGGTAPVLTRIETAAGHGTGKPAGMVATEWADLLTFVAAHTGLRVPT